MRQMRLEHLGLLNGTVTQVSNGVLHVAPTIDESEKLRLAAKINWLKKHSLKQADDKRSGSRFMPRNPRGHLTVGGAEHECFIIAVSASGVALSARSTPPLGAQAVIGNLSGTVMRHFEGGFGLRFHTVCRPENVEAEVTAPHLAIDSGAGGSSSSGSASSPSAPRRPPSRRRRRS